MTNDNLKRAIRAHMAEHGVNYTTARRAITAANQQAPWFYTHRAITDPEAIRTVNRAFRKPRIKPWAAETGETGWHGQSWEADTLREFPFLRTIDTSDNRPHLRFADPYDIHDDTTYREASDMALAEAEASGVVFPPANTLEGHLAREPYFPNRDEHPMFALVDDFQSGQLHFTDALDQTTRYLKDWPGSIKGWEVLGYLNWEIANGTNWSMPFPKHIRDEATATMQRAHETGVAIGQKALPPVTNAIIQWGHLDNRPFLRCLHGLAMSHYRAGQTTEAAAICTDLLWLNPNDNQGIRYILRDLNAGKTYTQAIADSSNY